MGSEAEEPGPAPLTGPVAVLRRHLRLPEVRRGAERRGDRQGVTGAGLRGRGAGTGSAPLGEDWVGGARRLKGRRLLIGFPVSLRDEEKFPMSLWSERRVDVWREVLAAVPRAVTRILKVRRERLFVTRWRPRPARVQPQDGIVVLVDFGAEKPAAQAALRLRLQGGHLARKQLVSVFGVTAVPAS